MPRTTYLVSDAHEWVYAHGLCDAQGQFDPSLHQDDSVYVPALACEDLLAEHGEYTAMSESDAYDVSGIGFPDGSVLFWDDDQWSVTDPEGFCISGRWRLEPK